MIERVLMTADAVGGVWTYAVELSRALSAHGVRTTLAVMGPPPSDAQRAAARRVAELHEAPFALEWAPDPWADVAAAGQWLLALERVIAPDVVHVNGFSHCALPFAAPVLMVAHSCVCTWWRACKGDDAPSEWDRYRAAVRDGLAGADAIVAPTRAMLDAFLGVHDPAVAHHDRARVIANAIDPTRFAPADEKEPLVLAAGRLWDEAKNVAALDAIAGDLPWDVVIAGSDLGPDGERVTFRGATSLGVLTPDEIASWMGRAAIYALPARYEPFGLSALEAALSGCALVLGDVPSLREVWGGAARYVDPDDPAALRRTIEPLIDAPTVRADLALRARRRALELARPDVMADSYLDLYSALLGRRARRAASCA
ncbi:glycosyltransferase family 4 protein [Sandaracinus amylolyticus]|uniref:glycosyltransferase family 4 protein n=1 Tax=Sandaracinus amylolyticus TaxID=927083 RepID=UPI001F1C4541|nr:glycosyltransferase family 4 protein [Sandaracinus amylolyticus]UJR83432.1 Hypothetical protein I5071_55000 [Sandaracinus amylolyticus]